jgi:hypothetical protein
MNNVDIKTMRLQPRQLYDIVIAYQTGPLLNTGPDFISEFGVYKDRESISCAVSDFNKVLQNAKGTIEIILGPLNAKSGEEEHIPYLHDVCENNTYFAHILGLDDVNRITFSELLRNPCELLQKHTDIVCNAIANMNIMYDTLDIPEQSYDGAQPRKLNADKRKMLKLGFIRIDRNDARKRA